MAFVSFAKLSQNFNMGSQFAKLLGGRLDGLSAGLLSWVSGEGHDFDLLGTGFTYGADGAPTGGTVTELRLDLGNNNEAAPDLRVTGLSFDLSALAPLVKGGLSSEAQNDLVWRTALADDDTVDFGTTATKSGLAIRFFGDGRNVTDGDTLFGADDVMTGDIGGSTNPLLSAQASGDVNIISAGTVYGGNDSITVTGTAAGSAVYGDAVAVYGFLAGGDDLLAVRGGGAAGIFHGDAGLLGEGGIATGGRDAISLAGSLNGATAVGDVADVYGRLSGGNDTITGSAGADRLGGDAITVYASGSLKGGSDTIDGGDGDDTIWGDWKTASGAAKGGNDKLYGGAGNDAIFGNGGNDLLAGGKGNDALAGGAGNDTFLFDTSPGTGNADRIADFANAAGDNDTIQIDDAVFSGGGLVANQALSAGAFAANAKGVATEADDRIVYNTSTGQLFWDADGSKPGGVAPMLFATLDGAPTLTSADFFVV